MPKMGVPHSVKSQNPFGQISMGPKTKPQEGAARSDGREKMSKAQILNQLAGKEDRDRGVKYVDREEHNKMGKNEFLKLLSHQLSNQDPMNPMDQKKFAADLAQFSQLEQLSNMNSSLGQMSQQAPSRNKFFAASFIGKKVATSGNSLRYDGEAKAKKIQFSIPQHAKKVVLHVMDEKGQVVKRMNLGERNQGLQQVYWSGRTEDGQRAAEGNYSLQVMAWDPTGMPLSVDSRSEGVVQGVQFQGGRILLTLRNGKQIEMNDVLSFEAAGPQSPSPGNAQALNALKAFDDNGPSSQDLINKKAPSKQEFDYGEAVN